MSATDDPWQLYEVGRYGDLTSRPNPADYIVLTVPDFDSMLPGIEDERGRKLTPEEIERERNAAPSIGLTKEEAAQMIARRTVKQ